MNTRTKQTIIGCIVICSILAGLWLYRAHIPKQVTPAIAKISQTTVSPNNARHFAIYQYLLTQKAKAKSAADTNADIDDWSRHQYAASAMNNAYNDTAEHFGLTSMQQLDDIEQEGIAKKWDNAEIVQIITIPTKPVVKSQTAPNPQLIPIATRKRIYHTLDLAEIAVQAENKKFFGNRDEPYARLTKTAGDMEIARDTVAKRSHITRTELDKIESEGDTKKW